jgi:hypothetical protein
MATQATQDLILNTKGDAIKIPVNQAGGGAASDTAVKGDDGFDQAAMASSLNDAFDQLEKIKGPDGRVKKEYQEVIDYMKQYVDAHDGNKGRDDIEREINSAPKNQQDFLRTLASGVWNYGSFKKDAFAAHMGVNYKELGQIGQLAYLFDRFNDFASFDLDKVEPLKFIADTLKNVMIAGTPEMKDLIANKIRANAGYGLAMGASR